MARAPACCSPLQNLPSVGEDEFASVGPTEGNITLIPTSVMLHAPNPACATAPAAILSLDQTLFMELMKSYLKALLPS